MNLRRIIECDDRREFDKLTKEQVEFADKITVGGTVVKNRTPDPATYHPHVETRW